MNKEEFREKIIVSAKKLDIELNEGQIEKLYIYMNLLIEWNQNINLTAIIEPNEIILKHFIDSFTIAKHIGVNKKLIDVGTGAGFPGIPLKILRDDIEVVLLDSLNKRIKFLEEVIEKTNLDKITAIHGRMEEVAQNIEHREVYDVVTSRAVANLTVLSEYMIPFCKISGIAICMKGSNVDLELKESKKAIDILGGKITQKEEFNLIDTDNMRSVIIIEKNKYTPKQYPRKAGLPSKEPIGKNVEKK